MSNLEHAKLIKLGKPVTYYLGQQPICRHCKKCWGYDTYECKHPNRRDYHEYTEPCLEIEWGMCPLKDLAFSCSVLMIK